MQENDLQANKHWHFTLRNGRSTFMVNLSNYKKKPEFAFITRILDKFDIRSSYKIYFWHICTEENKYWLPVWMKSFKELEG